MHIYYTTPTTTNLIYLNGSSPVWMHIAYTNYYAMIIHAEGEKEREREKTKSFFNQGGTLDVSTPFLDVTSHFPPIFTLRAKQRSLLSLRRKAFRPCNMFQTKSLCGSK